MLTHPSLKNRKTITSSIDTKLYDALETLHQETRIPKSRLLDEAIELLLKQHRK